MSRAIFNGLSGGTVTLDAQDTVDTKVLVIPAANGTLLYDDGTGTQTFDNIVVTGNAELAAGQVLAVPSASDDIANKAYVDSEIVAAQYTAGTGLTLAGQEFSITNTGATPSTYGSASIVPVFTLNAQGQLTSAVNTAIAIAATQVTSGTLDSARLTGAYPNVIAGSATNVVGGLSGSIPYQTAVNTTAMLAKGTNGQVLSLTAGFPAWIDVAGVGTVTSVNGSGGTTGLTLTGGPITASGTLTLGGTLATVNGGTGINSFTVGDLLYSATTNTLSKLPVGTNSYILTVNAGVPSWQPAPASGVTSFSAGTTGFTPSTGTTGDVTLSGTLAVANGGTNGSATPVAGAVPYGTGTAYAFTSAGTSGQVLQSNGASAPTWVTPAGGVTLSNDTATATNLYPTFASATSGSVSTIYTGNARLLYKPSTGELQSTVLNATNGIVVNNATISENYIVAAGNNAISAGPVTINSGVTVTVSSGSTWVVL